MTQQAIGARHLSFPRLAHPTADLQIRRALLPRFPYALVFVELEHDIRVLAVYSPQASSRLLAQPPSRRRKFNMSMYKDPARTPSNKGYHHPARVMLNFRYLRHCRAHGCYCIYK